MFPSLAGTPFYSCPAPDYNQLTRKGDNWYRLASGNHRKYEARSKCRDDYGLNVASVATPTDMTNLLSFLG